MSSILTNMSAMTAVANLAATQKSLSETQNQISTGLKISSAKDNAAYYSIATTMRTNIGNLSAVSDALNLGSSVVATATASTNNLTTVLQSISKALVSASQPGTDLNAVNTQIAALRVQLANTVATSSFNGVNLLDGSNAARGNAQVKFVAGVTGSGANTAVNTLTVDTTNTNFQGADYDGSNALITTKTTTAAALATATTNKATATAANTAAQTALTAATTAKNNALSALTTQVGNLASGDLADATAGNGTAAFKAIFGNNAAISSGVVTGIAAGSIGAALVGSGTNASVTINTSTKAISAYGNGSGSTDGALTALYGASATQATTTGTAGSAKGVADAAATALATATTAFNTASAADTAALTAITNDTTASKIYNGALFSLSTISLTSGSADGTTPPTTSAQIATYLQQVGAAIAAVTNAAQTLGAASSNIDLQSTYTSALSDSLTNGVGSLVDADMNEASTRLNALQTQQQLGVQALSIANQNSQLILKLFQ